MDLREDRKALGLSSRALAHRARVAHSTVLLAENDPGRVAPETVEQIAVALRLFHTSRRAGRLRAVAVHTFSEIRRIRAARGVRP